MAGNASHLVVLVSGGPDGELAARVLERDGVRVTRLHLDTGFVRRDRRGAVGLVEPAAAEPASPVEGVTVADVRQEYLRVVVAGPRHGRGRAMEPCLDCHAFMLRTAHAHAARIGADGVATGEVVGQHPWSQSRSALDLVAELGGAPDRTLRPLCARRLAPTALEREGRLDRDRMLDLHGRAREGQRRLAEELDVSLEPQPGGRCCLLADPAFAARVRDLIDHRDPRAIDARAIERLRVGRHFRLGHRAKAIVARNEAESIWLRATARAEEWTATTVDVPGPTVLIEGEVGPRERERVAVLAVRFGRARDDAGVAVELARGDDRVRTSVATIDEDRLRAWRIGRDGRDGRAGP